MAFPRGGGLSVCVVDLTGGVVVANKVEGVYLNFLTCQGEKDTVSGFKLSSLTSATLLIKKIRQIKTKAAIGFGSLF